ncbi:hypothetical protein GL177_14530 [Vibrio toranzoniae]|uniref:polysialyltransferase family glycosyltransferase n=1 Tax=Vibrio toranzoniae TaxID=1194427 RepID=UPI0013785A16|nr:polysialyltransferase family glycosyltransferase [Vibrio toranzoniae]NAZ54559.1 hypothetical protein [Vibrio toranzoniae]
MKSKDIYICSTVRHLLFSLYKSQDSTTTSMIIFFYDYQNIDPKSISSDELPGHIELILVNRKQLVNNIKESGFIGKYILFSALHSWPISDSLKSTLVTLLKKYDGDLDFDHTINTLFLYNDNNKMSRLFRLLSTSYSMIEDGMGNYVEHKIDSRPKQLLRFLSIKKPQSYVFGERRQCAAIYAIHPEKLPKSVLHKGRKLILSKNKMNISNIQRCFRFDDTHNLNRKTLIIATQPTFNKLKGKLVDTSFFYKIYDLIISKSKSEGFDPVLKLHPKENESDYSLFKEKGVTFLSNKLPLELYLLSSIETVNIISINSSAGIGMEEYCNIYKLIPDSEISNFVDIISKLEKNEDSLQDIISFELSKINDGIYY